MEFIDSKTAYKAPRTKSVEVKSMGMLCSSPEGNNTENFTLGNNRYYDDDWE